ncbi:hypothetical protein, partial [Shewanella gelidii]|uniref:hypothetical protein n=1 Tax=Shewanella gelidii TaxID=1642821 RepID=UPI00200C9733
MPAAGFCIHIPKVTPQALPCGLGDGILAINTPGSMDTVKFVSSITLHSEYPNKPSGYNAPPSKLPQGV